MFLEPVVSGRRVALGDREARPPAGLPERDALKEGIANLSDALARLQRVFYADRRYALLVILQGRDASGKDGTIRKVFGGVNPQGCEVTSFGPPSEDELRHDFLWRVHRRVPARGTIGIFNRSHYEDVVTVRARALVPQATWRERYEQVNAFEGILAANGVAILKFFLHVSRAEQKRRLESRLADPEKRWKFREGDLDDRKRWGAYTAAYQDALSRCSTPWAPWYVVPADDKRVRDWLVATTVVRTLEQMKLRYPPAAKSLKGVRVT